MKARKAFVKEELPYLLLTELYKDCRQSARALGKKFGVSYHTVARLLGDLERKYSLVYTLNMDEQLLGFAQGKLITIKFKTVPPMEVLMKSLVNSLYVQSAYSGNGDFDLLMYVTGLSPEAFVVWIIMLQDQLSEYGAVMKIAERDNYVVGFFPLRNEIIELSPTLSPSEKCIIRYLNENSKLRLKELVKKSRMTQMQVVYTIKKLEDRGIIRSFSALTQAPDKRVWIAYAFTVRWYKTNHIMCHLNFWKEIVKEDFHEVTNDYCFESDTHGGYAKINICTFRDGEELLKRGPELRKRTYSQAGIEVSSVVLTNLIVGKWPFHLGHYELAEKNMHVFADSPEVYPFGGTWTVYMKGIDLKSFKKARAKRLQMALKR